jgi:hypothetical protein
LRAIAARRGSRRSRVPFVQTSRYARGRIIDRLRDLPPGGRISLLDLYDSVSPQLEGRSFEEMSLFVGALQRDGLVTHDGTHVALRE